ncbi:MAG: DUF4347 domain-containing protein, partial [Chloroflexi bacterium]|nr:DUF4347 domain-containing protein [Chloroflexota bacterium]
HIVSHGAPGQVVLGGLKLNTESLNTERSAIAAWGDSLVSTGDILLYGCSIGQGQVGDEFVQQLAAVSGVDIAASVDPTGAANLGGDWDLEFRTGAIEAELGLDVSGFDSLLAEVTPHVSWGGSSDVTVDLELTYDGITETIYDVPEVYVRTSAAGVLQYGTDGSSYTDVDDGSGGLVVANYASLSIELTFWLEATDGEYSRLLWNLDETIVTRLHVGDFYAPGVDLSMDALRIEVDSGATVSTRDLATSVTDHLNGASDANSGNLSFSAKSIIVESGAQILTHVDSASYRAGDLTMTAQSGIDNISSFFHILPVLPEVVITRAFVDLTDATIKTGAMIISTEADSADLFDDESGEDETILTTVEDSFAFFTSLSVMAGFSRCDARAEVTISAGSIKADSLTITANADTQASVTVIGFFLGFGMTELYPTAKITIKDAAEIETTGDVSLTTNANGESTLFTYARRKYAGAVSLGLADFQAITSLSSDSSISAGGTVSLNARATKAMSVRATASTGQTGRVGIAIAYSQANATVHALADGTIEAGGDVSMDADLTTTTNYMYVYSIVGESNLKHPINNYAKFKVEGALHKIFTKLGGKVPKFIKDQLKLKTQSGTDYGASGAASAMEHTNNVVARIGASADVSSDTGDVLVLATSTDLPHLASLSDVESSQKAENERKYSVSVGLTLGLFTNNATAYIAPGARVTALLGDLLVQSETRIPWEQTWWKLEGNGGVYGVLDNLSTKVNFSLGIEDGLFTSWAEAYASGTKQAWGGSINVLIMDSHSNAYIGEGALVTVGQDTAVIAYNESDTVNFAGQFIWALIGEGTTSGGTGVGGSVVRVEYDNEVRAQIKSQAVVDTGSLLVMANTDARNVSLVTQGGKADSFGVNGAASALLVDNQTLARIDDSAKITVGTGQVEVARDYDEVSIGEASLFSDLPHFNPFDVYGADEQGNDLVRVDVDADTITLTYDHGLEPGDAVLYSNGGGTSIGGLTSGQVYYVYAATTNSVQLAQSPGSINPIVLDLDTTSGFAHSIYPGVFSLDQVSDEILYSVIDMGFDHGLTDGQTVVYHSNGNADLDPLVDGQTYFVHLEGLSEDDYELEQVLALSSGSSPLYLDTSVTSGNHVLVPAYSDVTVDNPLDALDSDADGDVDLDDEHIVGLTPEFYVTDLSLLVLASDKAGLYSGVGGLTIGRNAGAGISVTVNQVRRDTQALIGALELGLTPAGDSAPGVGVDSQDEIYLGYNHGFADGEQVTYTSGGDYVIAGLLDGETYFVNLGSDSDSSGDPVFTLARTALEAAENSSTLFSLADLTSSTGWETIDLGYTHGFQLGDLVRYRVGPGSSAAGGLQEDALYYIIPVSSTSVALTEDYGDILNLVHTMFDPAEAVSSNTLVFGYEHDFYDDQPLLYTAGGGTPIGDLSDGMVCFVQVVDEFTIALTDDQGDPYSLDASVAAGRSHTLHPGFAPTTDNINSTDDVIDLGYTHGLDDGDALRYDSLGETEIHGLGSGSVYYVIVDGAQTIALTTSAANAEKGQWRYFHASEEVDAGSVIDVGSEHGYDTGDAVVYSTSAYYNEDANPTIGAISIVDTGGQVIGSLVHGQTYYVVVVTSDQGQVYDPDTGTFSDVSIGIRLAATQAQALSNDTLLLDTSAAAGVHGFCHTDVRIEVAQGTASGSAHVFQRYDRVDLDTSMGSGTSHALRLGLDPSSTMRSTHGLGHLFTPSTTTVTDDTINLGYTHGFATGDAVVYSSGGGNSIGGIGHGSVYYVVVQGAQTIQLVENADEAGEDSPELISLDGSRATGSSHGFGLAFRAEPVVDSHLDTMDFGWNHGLLTGDALVYDAGEGTAIGGLTTDTTYYVIRLDATTLQLAATWAQATAATPTAIPLDGTKAMGLGHSLGGLTGNGFVQVGGQALLIAHNGGDIISVSLAASIANKTASGTASASGTMSSSGVESQDARFGVAVAGDVTVNVVNDTARACIQDVSASARSLELSARNRTLIGSGSGAVAFANSTENSKGIAGSFSFNVITNTAESVIKNAVIIITSGDLIVDAINNSDIYGVGAGGAGTSGTLALAGSVVVNVIASHAQAKIVDDSDVSVSADPGDNSTGNVSVQATENNRIVAVAGALAVVSGSKAKSQTGFGAAIALNIILSSKPTEALIEDSDVTAQGIVTVKSDVDNSIDSITAAVAFAEGFGRATAIAVSLSVNVIGTQSRATVRRKKQTGVAGAKGVIVWAKDVSHIVSIAGNASFSDGFSGSANGAALSVNVMNITVVAKAVDTTVLSTGGDVQVKANAEPTITSVAAGGSVSNNNARQGSFSINVINNKTKAFVTGSGSRVGADGSVLVHAEDHAVLVTVAGSVSLGSLTGGSDGISSIGIANSTVVTHNSVMAYVDDGVTVQANANQAAFALFTGERDSGNHKIKQSLEGVLVQAESKDKIFTVAAGGSLAGDGTAVAGSATVTVMHEKVHAYLGQDTLINTDASLVGSSATEDSDDQSVLVRAIERTDLTGIAGAVSVSFGEGGMGAGIDVAAITKSTKAWIDLRSTVEATDDVFVQAYSLEEVISVSAAIGLGKSVGLAGGVGVSVLTIDTFAYIAGEDSTANLDGAVVVAQGNVLVSAQERTELDMGSGSLAFGKDTGAGASVDVPLMFKDTKAWIGQEAVVKAYAKRSGITVHTGDFDTDFNSGSTEEGEQQPLDLDNDDLAALNDDSYIFDRNASPATRSGFKGVAVTAVGSTAIELYTLGAAASGNAAFQASIGFKWLNDTTEATIGDGAEINQGTSGSANTAQSVLVTAGNDFFLRSFAGGGTIATNVAVTPGLDVGIVFLTTKAWIGIAAKVDALRDVEVTAFNEEDIVSAALAIAGSGTSAALAGSFAVIDINNVTYAFIDGFAVIDANGNVRVYAEDRTDTDVVSGSVAIGVTGGGAGVSLSIALINKDTQAFIDDYAKVDAKGLNTSAMTVFDGEEDSNGNATTDSVYGLAVYALSVEDMFALSVSGGGGLFVGVAGALNWQEIDSDTHARIGDGTLINTAPDNNTANQAQDVYVTAVNRIDATGIAGSIAGTLGGTLGAGVDIGTIANETRAILGGEVHARDDVHVAATADWDIWSLAMAASISGGGLTGGIINWTLGEDVSGQYSTDGNSFDSMTGGNGGTAGKTTSVMNDSTDYDLTYAASGGTGNNTGYQGTYANGALDDLDSANSLRSSGLFSETQALINDDADIVVGDDVTVKARQDLDFAMKAGGLTATGVGVGAGVGIVRNGHATVASIGTTSATTTLGATVQAEGDVKIQATTTEDMDGLSFAGTYAVFGGAAAYTEIDNTSVQSAFIGNFAHITGAEKLEVLADHDRDLKVTSGGGSYGVISIGIAAGKVTAEGEVVAFVGSGAVLGDTDNNDGVTDRLGSVTVQATSTITRAKAKGVAVAGGIYGSGAGVDMRTEVDPLIQASLGSDAEIYSSGAVRVIGNTDIESDTESRGYAGAAGLAIGVSFATNIIDPEVKVGVGGDAIINAPNITSQALHNVNTSGSDLSNKSNAMAAASAG